MGVLLLVLTITFLPYPIPLHPHPLHSIPFYPYTLVAHLCYWRTSILSYLALRINNIRDTSRHSSSEVTPCLAQAHDAATLRMRVEVRVECDRVECEG